MLERFNYDSPHPLNRTGQQEVFNAIIKFMEGDKKYFILSAPTGLGKTGVIAELTKYYRVMALVRTKVLQESVYGDDYNFKLIKGKGNYPCAYSPDIHRADVCGIPDDINKIERYELCEGGGKCSYYAQLEEVCASARASTTYAKFISDRKPYNDPDIYIFDEAHDVPELIIEQSGFQINVKRHRFLKGFGEFTYLDNMDTDYTIDFMRRIYGVALKNKPELSKPEKLCSDVDIVKFKRQMLKYKLFLKRIQSTAELITEADKKGLDIWHQSITKDGEFAAKPMTASYHFKSILNTGNTKTILMSATVSPLIAGMLGIDEDNFEFYEAPQQYPVSYRTIWDLGQPGMGKSKTEANPVLWNLQAMRISNVLKLRHDVSSVILVTSKVKAKNLANKLSSMGYDTFLPPMDVGTDGQLYAWERYRKPGAVCVSYNFWEGVSLSLDHMLFIAGIKYPDLSSPFERARRDRSRTDFNYRTAVQVVQGSGRIQRGFLSHYLPVGSIDNLTGKMVFIVDGNYKNIQKYAPGDFMKRIKPW